MILKQCQTCGKDFYVKPYKKDTARFCSCACWTTTKESREIVSKTIKASHKNKPITGENNPNYKGHYSTCEMCGKKFESYPSRKRLFCSQECSKQYLIGVNSPNWKGGVSPRTTTSSWMKLRVDIIKRDNGECKYCGRKSKLIVHHIIPVRYGGEDNSDNLETICTYCHPTIEKRDTDKLILDAIHKKCEQCIDFCIWECTLYPFKNAVKRSGDNKTKANSERTPKRHRKVAQQEGA